MIILGVLFLLVSFLGLWIWLSIYENQIKKYLKKIAELHRKLQEKQFYLTGLFRFFHVKLPPSWVFGLPLILGSLVLITSSWIFGVIAEDIVSKDPLTLIDADINKWFFSRTSPPLTRLMLFVTDLASFTTMIIVYLVLVVLLTWKKLWYNLVFLSLSIPGGMLLNHMMKVAFHRPRPLFHLFYSSSLDYSFPSGHTMNATLLYGIIAIFALHVIKRWCWQVFVVLFTVFLVILVALSRVYLGYHYLSDTLAAVAIGIAWLSLCFMATMTLKEVGGKSKSK
jgi:membrane-associated phospholipid phosphatase